MTMTVLVLALTIVGLFVGQISGHGRMIEPPNRSSIWRYTSQGAPANYRDDMNFCGGKTVQFNTYGGKCGLCGDAFGDPHPQANENGGTYGRGIIAGRYTSGQAVPVSVELTTNHKGFFLFSLCVLSSPNAVESGEGCFQPLKLGDGSDRYTLSNTEEIHYDTFYNTTVQLPSGLKCERCVLRWHYTVANSWGICDNGQGAIGCGDQETFRSCSDITIS